MKQALQFLSIFLSLLILSACMEARAVPMLPNENNLILSFKNNETIDFTALEINLYQNGELKTTKGVSQADGTTIEQGEVLSVEFLDQVDLELAGEAMLEVVLIGNEDQERIPLREVSIELSTNQEYFFILNGTLLLESNNRKELE